MVFQGKYIKPLVSLGKVVLVLVALLFLFYILESRYMDRIVVGSLIVLITLAIRILGRTEKDDVRNLKNNLYVVYRKKEKKIESTGG